MKVPRKKQRGMALVLVLSLTALMTVLLVALLGMSRTELSASKTDLEATRTRALADTALNVAISQLRTGTSQWQSDTLPAAWTSQPGAIRVHTANGELKRLYKLYSSDRMSVDTLADLAADTPADWADRPAEFVDLNAPVISPDGGKTWPIVDPSAKTGNWQDTVEGFDWTGDVAMPVRWLYVLQDATLGTLDREGRFIGPKPATADNPIVGRVAFWTDDETCKINVNTASEGVYWDTPRAANAEDRALAEFQPARGEYQRYPGHPAQVSLSSVLFPNHRWHPPGSEPEQLASGRKLKDLSAKDLHAIWTEAPGISADAHRTTDGGRKLAAGIGDPNYTPPANIATPAQYHLHSDPGAGAKRGFFLTARSAAPETTLWGTPRVSLWPVHGAAGEGTAVSGFDRATAFDRTMAFVSTAAGRPYYVQRRDAKNGWWDFHKANDGDNALLFHYLSRLTDRVAPGFEPASGPRTFGEKYGTGLDGDRDQILVSMLDWIRQTNMNDGNLEWNAQFSVICPGLPEQGYGQITPLTTLGGAGWKPSQPLSEKDQRSARGFGRMMTVSELALVFSCRAMVVATPDGQEIVGKPTSGNRARLTTVGDREVEVGLLVEGFVPAQGWTDYRPYCSLSLGGTPADGSALEIGTRVPEMTLNGQPLELPTSRFLRSANTGKESPGAWIAWGGATGPRCFTSNVIAFKPVVVAAQTPLAFSGSHGTDEDGRVNSLRLGLYDDPASGTASGTAGNGDLVQVVAFELPQLRGLPAPELPMDEDAVFPLEERFQQSIRTGRLVGSTDVVQSLVPRHGDYRLVAAERRVPVQTFVPHPRWGLDRFAHSLREPWMERQAVQSTPLVDGFIPGLKMPAALAPDFPVDRRDAGAFDALRRDGGARGPARPEITGDFDNGVAGASDGAFINRADDGDLTGYKHGTAYFDAPATDPMAVPKPSKAAFSPNRLMPSAAMFGSLPTGVRAGVPWQTLLFRPQEKLDPGAWSPQTDHYGWKTPRDHLFLDLFWMPTVEPYALSTPFATAGKINLNHQILPFRHIRRATALHALLKSEKLMAIPDTASESYKQPGHYSTGKWRHYIDADATIRRWDEDVAAKGRAFLSPTEICEHYLVPEGQGNRREQLAAFWKKHRLTGDNTRERPYANLLGRLTTRSNTYRVHFVAQAIQQVKGSAAGGGFDSRRDRVTGEFAGTAVVERHVDPNDPDLPDYAKEIASGGTPPPLDAFHSWRITSFQQLLP